MVTTETLTGHRRDIYQKTHTQNTVAIYRGHSRTQKEHIQGAKERHSQDAEETFTSRDICTT